MVASNNSSNNHLDSPGSSTPFNKHLSQPETTSSSLSTSSSSLNTPSNAQPPRESIDLNHMPTSVSTKKGGNNQLLVGSTSTAPQRESEVSKEEEASTEEKTCLDMYMQSPCSGIWMYDIGDKLDKIHPILSIPFYVVCCPFSMPCIFLSGCLMASDGSSEDDDVDTATPYALKKKKEENSKEGKVQ